MKLGSLVACTGLVLVSLAGCIQEDADEGEAPAKDVSSLSIGDLGVHFEAGSISSLHNEGEPVTVEFPDTTLHLVDGRWQSTAQHTLPSGATFQFLPAPGASTLLLTVNGVQHEIPSLSRSDSSFLDGSRIIEFMRIMEAQFPDHNPGMPSYVEAGNWAGELLGEWGYEVEIDEYATRDLPQEFCPPVPVSGQKVCPASFANVVGTKPGANPDAGSIIVGGHYDIVPQVTHGAYDNTAGAVTVLAIAEALAPYTFDHTLIFALWGGEESGTLGSSSWIASHPEQRAQATVYWNLDVIGNSWPAPAGDPTRVHIEYGPDGGDDTSPDPAEEALRSWAESLVGSTGYPEDAFDYAGVVEQQSTSDHVAFMAEGIPIYSPNSMPEAARITQLHTEEDTLTNMSKYALWGLEFEPSISEWPDDAARLEAEAILERSFEPYMWLIFHHVLHSDARGFHPLVPDEGLP